MKNMRKTYLIRPKMQLKIIVSMVLVATVIMATVAWLTYSSLEQSEEMALMTLEAVEAHQARLRWVAISLSGLVITSSVGMLFLGIFLTQKVAGPLVPIERLVAELIEGNYDALDIQLRSGDELVDLAGQLNQLKQQLKRKHGTKV